MKKKRLLVIGLQSALVVGFSFTFYQYVQNEVQPREVYVYNKDLDVNTLVSKNDLAKVTVPAKAVTKDFALDVKDIVGKYVTTKTFANTFVYEKQLVEIDEVNPFDSMDMSTLRKISLPIDYINGFGGDIKNGDKVDLVFTGEGTKVENDQEKAFKYSKVFLQNVYVFGVSTEDGKEYVKPAETNEYEEGEKIDTSANNGEIAVVTLAVTLEQAEEINARLSSGEVKLLGRFDDNKSYETLGFVLGEFGKVYAEKANAETGRATINEDSEF